MTFDRLDPDVIHSSQGDIPVSRKKTMDPIATIDRLQATVLRLEEISQSWEALHVRAASANKLLCAENKTLLETLALIRDMGHDCPPGTDPESFYKHGMIAMAGVAVRALERTGNDS